MTRIASRLLVLLVIVTALLTIPFALFTRAHKPGLPPLLYSIEGAAHLLRAECQTFLAACQFPDQVILRGLDSMQAVAQWSPDGDYLAAHHDDGWRIYESACLLTGNGEDCASVPLSDDLESNASTRLAWGPDGSTLAYLTQAGSQLNVQTSGCWTGAPPEACQRWDVPLLPTQYLHQPFWSDDGSQFVFTGQGGLHLLDVACVINPQDCNNLLTRFNIGGYGLVWPTLSADGQSVLVVALDTYAPARLMLIDTETQAFRWLTDHPTDSMFPAWSQDNRFIAYAAGDTLAGYGNSNIYLLDLARGLGARATNTLDNENYVMWGPAE
jgi:Tol biopolymer transport system component